MYKELIEQEIVLIQKEIEFHKEVLRKYKEMDYASVRDNMTACKEIIKILEDQLNKLMKQI